MRQWITILTLATALAACSDAPRDANDHVWKAQTDALKKAKQVDDKIQQADQERRKAIEASELGRPAE